MKNNPERLAYWYFRLNGFLTTENFIVHPDRGSEQCTDADLLAVRFAHRAENLDQPMEDDPRISRCEFFVNIVIAEVKKSECKLNGPWTRPDARNMHRVLKAIGCVSEGLVNMACENLYQRGLWSDDALRIRLFAIGNCRNPSLTLHSGENFPAQQQITWSEIINFLIQRFNAYRRQKSSVPQWTQDGQKLKRLCLGRDPETSIRDAFGLPAHDERC